MTSDTIQLEVLKLSDSGSLPNPKFDQILSKNGWVDYKKVPSPSWKNFKQMPYDEPGSEWNLFIGTKQLTGLTAVFRNKK